MSAPVVAAANTYLANIPSPDRGVWYLGPFPLRAYALCIIVGIVVAVWLGSRRWMARGGRSGTVVDIAVWAVPFGLIGGRLYHVATDWHKYFGADRNPLDALKIWEGGLGIWGAVALGALGAWIGCRRRGIPLPAFADAVAPGIVLAQAIGRLGNWFNQELYGAPTDLPWGLEIYRRIDETGLADPIAGTAIDHTPTAVVHPTFLYELLWNVAVFAVVIWADRKFRMGHGRVFALYVAGYTLGRLWIEMMRTDDATLVLGVRINVFTSLIVLALAVVYLLLVRGGREDPEGLLGKPMPGDSDYPAGTERRTDGPPPAGLPHPAEEEAEPASTPRDIGDDDVDNPEDRPEPGKPAPGADEPGDEQTGQGGGSGRTGGGAAD